MKTIVTCVGVVIAVSIARVSLEYRSVTTTARWLSSDVRCSEPKMSIATKPNSPESGNSCGGCFRL